MQSIGLTVEEIAIIYLALPFTTFLSPPVTGNPLKLKASSETTKMNKTKFQAFWSTSLDDISQ